MSPRRAEGRRHPARWLGAAAALAVAPKCFLCLAAYAGAGSLVGVGGPELCGDVAGAASAWPDTVGAAGALLGLAWLAAARGRPTARRGTD